QIFLLYLICFLYQVMRKFLVLFFSICSVAVFGQSPIKDIDLQVDSVTFSASKNTVSWQGQTCIAIQSDENAPLCRIVLHVNPHNNIDKIYLTPSSGFQVIDSVKKISDTIYSATILFFDLVYGMPPLLNFSITDNQKQQQTATYIVMPIFNVKISYNNLEDVFEEEEKVIAIPLKNAFNLYTDNYWMFNDDYDYKVTHTPELLVIKIKPHTLGVKQLVLRLKTLKPVMGDDGKLTTDLPILKIPFNVKANNLYYINFDKKVVYLDNENRNSEEITAAYNSALQLRKVYRVEDSEGDGNLIAELFTIAQVQNGTTSQIICRIKPYALHNAIEG